MKYSAVLFSLALSILVLACGGAPKMGVIEDPVKDRTIYRLSGLFVNVGQEYVGPVGNLGFRFDMYISRPANDTTFFVRLMGLSSRGWTIALGDTLSIKVDDNDRISTTCADISDVDREKTVRMMNETYSFVGGWYQISKELLSRMANAKSVNIDIYTSQGIVPVEMTSNKSLLKKFYTTYVE